MRSYNSNLFPFESKWIEVLGEQLHYIDEGEGPILLFSHAPIGSSFMYRDFIQSLKNRVRCIALDYPGFGLSSMSKSYEIGIKSQSEILARFIQILNLKDIFLFGHDTGGPSAYYVAQQDPENIKGLILTDTIIFPVSEYPRIQKMLKIVGSNWFSTFNSLTNFLVWGTLNFGIRTRKLSYEEKRAYYSMYASKRRRRNITSMLYSLFENESMMEEIKRSFEGDLGKIPSLLIYGEKDPVKELGIADRIHALLPESELFLIDNEGHFPHEAQGELMSHWILEWISRQMSSARYTSSPSSL